MYAYYNPTIDALAQDDINGITSKYGGDSPKNTLAETAVFAPGAAHLNNRTYVAWAGTDAGHHLNVLSAEKEGVWFDKVTLGDTSPVGVSLAAYNGRLYLAWSGTGNRQLNVMSSPDGVHWGNKVTLAETSPSRPVLAQFRGQLALGWTGTDAQHRLNVLFSPDGVHWGGQADPRRHVDRRTGPGHVQRPVVHRMDGHEFQPQPERHVVRRFRGELAEQADPRRHQHRRPRPPGGPRPTLDVID
jgi:hypothetical protein